VSAATEAIRRLLTAQVTLRNNRRLQASMRYSRLPAVKTLESFDFASQPSLKRERIQSLHELNFIERKENVVLLGPPGVGKTHLAISLAITVAQRGRRVYYGTLIDLITSLEETRPPGNWRVGWPSSPIHHCWWSTRSATCRSTTPVLCCSSS
jgi:DNA replication protein DnaC